MNHLDSPTRPNVLIIIATGITGGPGKGLFQLVNRARELGFTYTLCNFKRAYAEHETTEFREKARTLGIQIFFLRQNFPIDPLLILRARRFIGLQKINIVQTHGYKPNIIGFFLKTVTRIPWIAFAHGYTDDNWKVRTYNRLDVMALKYADTVVAVSHSMKKLLMRKGIPPYKIKIIHNAVDRNELIPDITERVIRESLNIERTQTVIGVVGRLGPEKGHIVFLKAFRDVLQQFPRTTALIVGEGQEKRNLVAFCHKANITKHVVFTGHVSNIADYYQIMDLLVIPSLSEGLPNVLLEAMVLGLPIIATSVGGIPEVINPDNGILIPPGDHVRMGEKMMSLLHNRARMDLLASNAKGSIVAPFDPDKRAGEIVHLYNFLLRP
ncbi:MAG: glycosyltransferase [Deltaproteobacteria bacterium]|nr:glycosyltransferase [Deltaproteobacteria bacterium]